MFIIFGIIVFISSSYAVLTYDNNDYPTYYVNSQNPLVNISVKSFADPFILKRAQINYEDIYEYNIDEQYPENYDPNEDLDSSSFGDDPEVVAEANKQFNIYDFNSSNSEYELGEDIVFGNEDEFEFFLDIDSIDEEGSTPETQGTPTRFDVVVDTQLPSIESTTNPEFVVGPDSPNVTIEFNEPLQYFKLIRDDEVLAEEEIQSEQNEDFLTSYEHIIDGEEENLYDFDAVLIDRAGNRVEENFSVLYKGPPLEIDLKTKADDSSIPYYYNSTLSDLFGNTIYTDSQNFELTFETSKPATCYFTQELSEGSSIAGDSVEGVLNHLGSNRYDEMNTNEGLNHTYSIEGASSSKKPFWVGCINNFNPEDTQMLSEDLTGEKGMLKHQYYDKDYSISVEAPPNFVGESRVFFRVDSTERAFCSVNSPDFSSFLLNSSQDFTQHTEDKTLETGEYSLEFSCYDVVYENKIKNKELEVDEDAGIDIILSRDNYYQGKYYSDSSQFDVSFTTSNEPESCGYSTEEIIPTISEEFNSLTTIDSTISETQFSFSTSSLTQGSQNTHYIYCRDSEGVVTSKNLSVLYDPTGPVLSNLYYNNFGIRSQSYIGSTSKLSLEFDVDSIIPVDTFNITLIGDNSTSTSIVENSKTEENYTKEITITDSLNEYHSVSILASTILNSTSSPLTNSFTVDISPPDVDLINIRGDWEVQCSDSQSDCAKSWIGTGTSEDSCQPVQEYSTNLSLNTTGYSYVCAVSQNNAGVESSVEVKEIEDALTNGTLERNESSQNESSLDNNQTETSQNNQSNESQEDPLDPEDPPEDQTSSEDDNTPYYILTALLLAVAFGGAGGWYVYRKGYLDTQLKKMGIPVSKKGKDDKKNQPGSSGVSSQNTQQRPNLVSKKSKYDRHLKKLNKFLDDAMNKKQEVFDSFGGANKGTKSKSQGSTKKSKKSFDEFYDASQNSSSKQEDTIEKETQEFEEYYKKKKEQKGDKEQNKGEKNKKKK